MVDGGAMGTKPGAIKARRALGQSFESRLAGIDFVDDGQSNKRQESGTPRDAPRFGFPATR
jgi:hypothetical protein